MARKSISWILEFTSKLPTDQEKVSCLIQNDNSAMRTILKYCFDPNIKWLLPEGPAPYQPNDQTSNANMLYSEARRLYLFIEGGNPDLNSLRREAIFIELLQNVSPSDAELLVSIKDKKLPFKGITKKIVLQAYPDLF